MKALGNISLAIAFSKIVLEIETDRTQNIITQERLNRLEKHPNLKEILSLPCVLEFKENINIFLEMLRKYFNDEELKVIFKFIDKCVGSPDINLYA